MILSISYENVAFYYKIFIIPKAVFAHGTAWQNVTVVLKVYEKLTFLLPGGAGSKILVCISLGRALYTGKMINSGTSGPKDFILS